VRRRASKNKLQQVIKNIVAIQSLVRGKIARKQYNSSLLQGLVRRRARSKLQQDRTDIEGSAWLCFYQETYVLRIGDIPEDQKIQFELNVLTKEEFLVHFRKEEAAWQASVDECKHDYSTPIWSREDFADYHQEKHPYTKPLPSTASVNIGSGGHTQETTAPGQQKNNRQLVIDKSQTPIKIGEWQRWPIGTKVFDKANNNKEFINLNSKPLIYCSKPDGQLYLKGEGLDIYKSFDRHIGVLTVLRKSRGKGFKSPVFVRLSDIFKTSAAKGAFENYVLCTPQEKKQQTTIFYATFEDGEQNTHMLTHQSPSSSKKGRQYLARTADQPVTACWYEDCGYKTNKRNMERQMEDLRRHVQDLHGGEPVPVDGRTATYYKAQLAESKKKSTDLEKEQKKNRHQAYARY